MCLPPIALGLQSITNSHGLNILHWLEVKMLRRINFLSASILETFYYKIVIPSVLYGIVIWGSGPKFKDLEMIHIRAARLIHKLPTSFKDSGILSKVGWMPLEYFYKFRILTITYNAYYNLGLREINSLITKNSNFLTII